MKKSHPDIKKLSREILGKNSKKTSFTIYFDELIPSELTPNQSNRHWGQLKGIKDGWKFRALNELRKIDWSEYELPWEQVKIRYDYYFTGKGFDNDNFQSGCKVIRDMLQHEGIIKDDGPRIVLSSDAIPHAVDSMSDEGFHMTVTNIAE